MRQSSLTLQCWPGLARLWHQGDIRSLIQALAYCALFNFFLVATFLWPGLLSGLSRWTLGGGLSIWWIASVWFNRRFMAQWMQATESIDIDLTDQLIAAQHQYLRGHWTESEAILRQILRKQPRDIEAGLLLCQVWRRSGHPEKALEQLGHLQKLDESLQWFMEIGREIQALEFEMSPDEDESELSESPELSTDSNKVAVTSTEGDAFLNHDEHDKRAA